ncbi:hypothetical protein F4820DRAFT_408641 [Hypoxylon rubiginosum]|uniref:Uncharacterized protein n=1 Tax=Hypoxylon rubiginosum TaxID=110542 RepID=A0ACB9ZBJ6_9PEZI|nr:hypothetical protein F4820DRAFT_408641 [Hypoxylon rubiginosum]
MAKIQRSNYLPYIQHHLDTQDDEDCVILDIECGICKEQKLDISWTARDLISSGIPPTKHLEAHRHLPFYIKHGLERTVALACGHVFGDRCIRNLLSKRPGDLTCPSCGFKVAYQSCGHAIRPALIPVDGYEPVRDGFPLTIAEGGEDPKNCLDCRWKLIRSNLRYALADECIFCRQMNEVHMPVDTAGHRTHRGKHIEIGIRQTLDDIVVLIWPEFVTRETTSSAAKAIEESDRRQIHVSLLNAMILSELEETIWYRSRAGKANHLTKEQLQKHARGVASIEQSVLDWIMNSTQEPRRMW